MGLERDGVDGSPAPAGDDRAVGVEGLARGFEHFGREHLGELVHPGEPVAVGARPG